MEIGQYTMMTIDIIEPRGLQMSIFPVEEPIAVRLFCRRRLTGIKTIRNL
jgi:hypothetical protein